MLNDTTPGVCDSTTLYTCDSKGRIRVWEIYAAGAAYYTRGGLQDGKLTDWVGKTCVGKNLGKTNATTAAEQALNERDNLIARKLKDNHFYTPAEALTNKQFRPMLAHETKLDKIVYPIYISPKLDGMRCNITLDKRQSRNGRDIMTVDHISTALHPVFQEFQGYLDGELYNHALKDNFETLISICKQQKPTTEDIARAVAHLQYHIYDLYLPDQPNASFTDRYAMLKRLLEKYQPAHVQLVEAVLVHNKAELLAQHSIYLNLGYEGSILRVPKSGYKVDQRSKDLLKLKIWQEDEFILRDVLEGSGAWAGKAKKVVVELPNKATCEAGIRGDFTYAENLLKNKEDLLGKKVTVRYFELTTDNKLRFGTMKTVRDYE
jgi:DNA ligase 1